MLMGLGNIRSCAIVSRTADGSKVERLSSIRGFGRLLNRRDNETDEEFTARADIELKEQDR